MSPARRRHLATIRICSDMAAPINQNTVLYFVIAEYKGDRYVVERELCDMTREETLHDLQRGDLTDVVSIIETEFTAAGGLSSRDVTAAMLMEADLKREMTPPDRDDAISARIDHLLDELKHWVAP